LFEKNQDRGFKNPVHATPLMGYAHLTGFSPTQGAYLKVKTEQNKRFWRVTY
jgi:hypothetical protein